MELEKLIINSLIKGDFVLYFQPQVNLKTNKVTGAEALIRMIGPDGNIIPPGVFIPRAEESVYLISLIGEWVIKNLPNYVFDIVKEIKEPIKFSFNISAKEFESKDFLAVFKNLVAKKNLTNILYGVEITETGLMKDIDYIKEILKTIHQAEFEIILDDFGTGFSSLKYLREFPIDQLKLDKSFADYLPQDKKTAVIVKHVVNLCKELGIKVIAEGIETEEQLKFCKDCEVDEVQGFYFSKPLPKDEFIKYVKRMSVEAKEELEIYNFIKWEEALSVKDDMIDIQHMILLNIINRFYNALMTKKLNHNMAYKLFTESLDYFKMHFNYEENFLKNIGFPDFTSHKNSHEKIMEYLKKLKDRIEKEKIEISEAFFHFLRDYYKEHITKEDKKFAEFLKKQEVNKNSH